MAPDMAVPNLVVPVTTGQGGMINALGTPGADETARNDDDVDLMGLPIYYMSDPEDNAQVKRWLLEGPDAGRFTYRIEERPTSMKRAR